MKEEKRFPVGIGVLSVCTILLVLALAVFATLTLASARADLALSQRAAETVRAYYAGQTQTVPLEPLEELDQAPLPVWDGTALP